MRCRGAIRYGIVVWLLAAALAARAQSPSALRTATPETTAPVTAAGVAGLPDSSLPPEWDARLSALEQRLNSLQPSAPPAPQPRESPPWSMGYDMGIFWEGVTADGDSFSLKINPRIQFRYANFAPTRSTWLDATGATHPITTQNVFEIERGRLVFSGHAFTKEFTYFLQIDGDTDDGDALEIFDAWVGYEFDDSLRVQAGKRKAPGSQQWQASAFNIRFADRSMATDFFRTDRTFGVWVNGALGNSDLHYDVMLGNGVASSSLTPAEVDNNLAAAGTLWWEPLGEFGSDVVVLDDTEGPRMRLGQNFFWTRPSGSVVPGSGSQELDFVRLSDGTRLDQTGALSPGVTVNAYTVYAYTLDAAWKNARWSINAECYLQWVEDIGGNGPLTRTSFVQDGFLVEGGYFLIPRKLDVNLRQSQVHGFRGTSNEYSIGCDWFFHGQNAKLTFDTTYCDGSAVNSTRINLLPGDRGMLYRLQFQAQY